MSKNIEREIEKEGMYLNIIVGDSMKPLLRLRRDQVVIVKIERALKRFDVVLYKRPDGQYVMHRILKIKKDVYLINGDNRYHIEVVPKEWVIGVMDGYYKDNKYTSINDIKYKLYVLLWCYPHIFRRCLLFIRHKIKTVLR